MHVQLYKKIYKPGPAQQSGTKFKPDAGAYYFHEDDYCQIEYLPKENFSAASAVAAAINEHAEKTFDSRGWTGCYVRNEATVPVKSKQFKMTAFVELLLKEGFSEYPAVTTGYSTAVFACDNIRAFKKQSIVLCAGFKGSIIENIWHNTSPDRADHEIYRHFLLVMAEKYNLLLADWRKSIVVDISNPSEIDKYFLFEE